MRKYILGSAMAALIAGATAAHAAPAPARVASPAGESEGIGPELWLGLLGAAALAVVIVGINDDGPDDDEFPVSP